MNTIIKILAPNEQQDDKDFGDCIIINDNGKVIVYDCGSEDLAIKVLEYLKTNGISKIDIVLSHNDEDHFAGIPYLINQGVVNSINTLLLLKYKGEIFDKIDDGRVTEESLKKNIEDMYGNIYSLKGQHLIDALDANNLSDNVKIVGPSVDYFIDAVSKQFTPTEGDTINSTTIMNAISVQLEVKIDNKLFLLTGDADFEAFKDKITKYDGIQLPHHGNPDMAEKIFDINSKRNGVIYIVSDNKGKNINGGSADLNKKGHIVKSTKSGCIDIDSSSFYTQVKGNLGFNEICYFKK